MRLMIVGEDGQPDRLAEALRSREIAVERPPAEPVPAAGEAAKVAAAMRAFEELLTGHRPNALLLASSSNSALAALLVATKLGIPVARLEGGADDSSGSRGVNPRLIRQLADTALAADPEAIAVWLGAT
jgi:UDP-N-acetylglucosamine 2-epimerase (non-hydrolysing)